MGNLIGYLYSCKPPLTPFRKGGFQTSEFLLKEKCVKNYGNSKENVLSENIVPKCYKDSFSKNLMLYVDLKMAYCKGLIYRILLKST